MIVPAPAIELIVPLAAVEIVLAVITEQRSRLPKRGVDDDRVVSCQTEGDNVLHVSRREDSREVPVYLDADLGPIDRPRLTHNHIIARRAGYDQRSAIGVVGVVGERGRTCLARLIERRDLTDELSGNNDSRACGGGVVGMIRVARRGGYGRGV